jgi:hypothetical protein
MRSAAREVGAPLGAERRNRLLLLHASVARRDIASSSAPVELGFGERRLAACRTPARIIVGLDS